MTKERLIEIFKKTESNWNGDNAYKGLQILAKYTDKLIQGAEHDIIYSEDIDVLIENGLTENDAINLRKLNWMIEDGCYLACFV